MAAFENLTSIECHSCHGKIILRTGQNAHYAICPSCAASYKILNGQTERTQNYSQALKPYTLPLGAKGTIKQINYEVVGCLTCKQANSHYSWREYTLYNETYGYIFLSEYDGHWNIVEEISDFPRRQKYSKSFIFKEREYELFSDYGVQYRDGAGEFFWNINGPKTLVLEYISPPYSLLRETKSQEVNWFLATYIHPKEIRKAFNLPSGTLPSRHGTYSNEPSIVTDLQKPTLYCMAAFFFLMFFIQLFFSNHQEQVIFEQTFNCDSAVVAGKTIISEPFNIKSNNSAETSSLNIILSAPVDNTWFESQMTLMNEDTGEEFYFETGVELYYGYTEGEHWREGSEKNDLILSEIPDGTYRLAIKAYQEPLPITYYSNISPSKDYKVKFFTINIIKDISITSNLWVIILLSLLVPTLIIIISYFNHTARWSNSNVISHD